MGGVIERDKRRGKNRINTYAARLILIWYMYSCTFWSYELYYFYGMVHPPQLSPAIKGQERSHDILTRAH